MKAIGLTEFGGPEVLRVFDLDIPEPGPGELRIRVHAVGVNPTDATFRRGGRAAQLADRPRPLIPGVDAAGVVDAVGPDTEGRLAVGDRVVAFIVPMGERGGSYAEYLVVDERSVAAAPAGASFPEAATLLLNAVTAQLALDALHLDRHETVAITGGAGAVGGYAIQLAKARGLLVVSDSSAQDEGLVRALGADLLVARGDDVAARIHELRPEGVCGLIDGSDQRTAAEAALAAGGVLASLKGWSGPGERDDTTIAPISSFDSARDHLLFDALRRLVEDGVLTLRVADVLPAAQAAEAHRRLEAGGVRGRLVLDFSSPIG